MKIKVLVGHVEYFWLMLIATTPKKNGLKAAVRIVPALLVLVIRILFVEGVFFLRVVSLQHKCQHMAFSLALQ
jgi:hypothetical protein